MRILLPPLAEYSSQTQIFLVKRGLETVFTLLLSGWRIEERSLLHRPALVTDLVVGELLLVVVEGELVLLVLQVDPAVAHGGELSGSGEEHHAERHDTSRLESEPCSRD